MRVVVTGAGGRLGRAVMARAQESGIEAVGVDRIASVGQGPTIVTDLCDLGQVCSVLAGADAVVHLGAIPAPVGYPPTWCSATTSWDSLTSTRRRRS